MTKQNYKSGDHIFIEIMEGEKGERIGMLKGLICIIDKYAKINPPFGELWECRVKFVKEKCLIVVPIEGIAGDQPKLTTLFPEKKQRREKVKKTYQYMSKNEQP